MDETSDEPIWRNLGDKRFTRPEWMDLIRALADMPASEAWRIIIPTLRDRGYSNRDALKLQRTLWIARGVELNDRQPREKTIVSKTR